MPGRHLKDDAVTEGSVIWQTLEKCVLEMGLSVSEENIRAFELFVNELTKWNRSINLTAIRREDEIAVKHVIDSLVLAGCISSCERLLDIGSGAGFPAIPLKIVKPEVQVTSVDAVGKKILFQRHVSRMLKLEGFEAVHTRVEAMGRTHAGHFDVIVSRAFARLEQFVALAAPLLAGCGRMIAMKGPAVAEELKEGEENLRKLGFEIKDIHPYTLPLDLGERNLIVVVPRQAP
jgi:16S rRNA (guanine527-N7)-methyltransferase